MMKTAPFWLAPKPEPLINKVPPTGPLGGSKAVITGLIIVNNEPAVTGLDTEFAVTVTGPVPFGAELGTTAIICELLQLVTDAADAPLKLTMLVPWVAPKFDPVMVTEAPRVPTIGDTLETNGVVPTFTDTLSKGAAATESLPLTARPMYAVWAMVTVMLPSCVQLVPSDETKPVKVFPDRTSSSHSGGAKPYVPLFTFAADAPVVGRSCSHVAPLYP